jgi:glycosyltransferase involved in cell wall biosynthesis
MGFKRESVFIGLYSVPLGRTTPDSIPGKEKSLLFVGRLVHEKNILNTIAGYLEYRNRVQNPYSLKIAGVGPLFDSLKNIPGVILLGYVNNQNLRQLFQDSDALVLMSTFEPWGVVISEATSNARPVICSAACGSSTDLVFNGINGYVVETPTISEISSVFEKFHNLTPAELRSMAEHSKSIAGNFGVNDWASTVGRIQKLIS